MIDLIKRVSTLAFAKTVTDVALMEWLVKGGSIPALFVISRSKLPRVLSPTGEFVYQTELLT